MIICTNMYKAIVSMYFLNVVFVIQSGQGSLLLADCQSRGLRCFYSRVPGGLSVTLPWLWTCVSSILIFQV